jgi:predicted small integral membrane protein
MSLKIRVTLLCWVEDSVLVESVKLQYVWCSLPGEHVWRHFILPVVYAIFPIVAP